MPSQCASTLRCLARSWITTIPLSTGSSEAPVTPARKRPCSNPAASGFLLPHCVGAYPFLSSTWQSPTISDQRSTTNEKTTIIPPSDTCQVASGETVEDDTPVLKTSTGQAVPA